MYLVDTRVGHPKLEAWKYPLPGDKVITMIERVIIDVERRRVVRLKVPPDQHRSTLCDDVICGGEWVDVQWAPDGGSLAFVSSSRDHKLAELKVADAQTGAVRDVMHELVSAHGIALEPGETAAVGRLGKTPLVALPGAADHAFSAWLALVLPLLDRLSGRAPRRAAVLPLARKIASPPGVAELVLVKREGDLWMPLAAGSLSLDGMRLADAWLIVPADSEGHAAASPVPAFPLRDPT